METLPLLLVPCPVYTRIIHLVQSHGSSCARVLRAASDRDAPTDLRS